ncbi:hypothetical protein LSH36_250g02043 [Paralvinella palmiformis]|uniref:Peptidase M14 domain-containing protein n=1 Tax=Paralvinella palmiformis TaxID=53620 RepID=A0AAD9N4G2_9ANNE|nr:hypothetical protein LSH36_250g02043 [Paralvinella palmiformis]
MILLLIRQCITHKVFRVTPTNPHHLKWLKQLGRQKHYDFWKEPTALHRPADVMVHPSKVELMMTSLLDLKMNHYVTIDDVQRQIDDQGSAKTKSESDFEDYMNYGQMEDWLSYTVSICGSRCELINLGQSYEGRNIWIVKISTGGIKRGIWLDAGIHAREWLAHHTGLYIIDRFVHDYGVDPDVDFILEHYDVYILPVVNPDGYVYTWTDDRMWRKTRNPHNGYDTNPCTGADANRNYDFKWMLIGASNDSCDNTYAGPFAHSEPETALIRDYIFNGNWEAYFALHTYGQLWLLPWGYTADDPPTYDELMRVANIGASALTEVYGTRYTVGSSADILYESSGTSRDWAYGHPQAQIPYAFTLELRDKSNFVMPPDQILPTAIETWTGFKASIIAIINGPTK